MALITSPRFWTVLGASLWALCWLLFASPFVFHQNYDALWILGIFSTPSSLIVSALSHNLGEVLALSNEQRFLLDAGGYLVFGSAQYGCIGFLVGKCLQLLSARWVATHHAL